MTRALMIQGTGSNVGKSMLVAGLCRAATRQGLSVAPFKPQNMSNNAAVTSDGGEIGRAQALQALACGKPMITDMNPVLLKPETDVGSQVVVQGRRLTTVKARDYAALKPSLMEKVLESFNRLKSSNDLVIVEGAGSPAEVNLRAGDIANMGFAQAADIPVILACDIDRGGVIAQIVGTQAVISAEDAALVAGFMVNKFRGDPSLFDDGYAMIEQQTGWPGFGVFPYFPEAWKLPAEDGLDIANGKGTGDLNIVCLGLSRIANFDDLDPLAQEDSVSLTMLRAGQPIPGDTDLVIIPGSKSTRGDLAFLREQGWDVDLQAHVRRGGHVLGICGGYQMLGQMIRDPEGIEGPAGEVEGLGLLQVETVMTGDKQLTETRAVHAASHTPFHGYEIHIGRTTGSDRSRPFAMVEGREEGAQSADGCIAGSYLHGMFRDDDFRAAWLASLGAASSGVGYDATVEATLDLLADHMERHLNVAGLLAVAK
ncbi:cobyric acid synthase [uncultured Shimia sp.]|uniref:cobyric acid synthase n=1 Tax=uncultured Shimia sp. TaxID=573152 RepID=UPI00260E4612|nr:cobyric acid synthase [uncultured Shimia sp.]